MPIIDNTYGTFIEPFFIDDEKGITTIHPEMYRAKNGISPTGRYQVYCIHPQFGSSNFVVEQDEKGIWICKNHPAFISVNFVVWIGERIEAYGKN